MFVWVYCITNDFACFMPDCVTHILTTVSIVSQIDYCVTNFVFEKTTEINCRNDDFEVAV